MATKKSDKPNKSAFIRQHPDLSPSEVIAKGKEAGLAFSAAFVSAIRSKVRAAKPSTGRVSKRSKRGPQPKTGGMSASDFVRSMPASMRAGDVMAAARAKGIKMSSNLVYAVRSAAKKRAGGSAAARGQARTAFASASSGDVLAFKKMAFDLGISAARQALDELERGIAALMG